MDNKTENKVIQININGWLAKGYEGVRLKENKEDYGENLGKVILERLDYLEIGDLGELNYDDWTRGDYFLIDGVFVRYYISNKKATWDEAVESQIRNMAGVMKASEGLYGYSEYSIEGSIYDVIIGHHDLLNELESYIDKYLLLKIDIKIKEQHNIK